MGGEEVRKRGLLARVARHRLVGQREPLRRHHQADHHLHAVRALVAAVAELPQTLERRVALEVGARQVVQQHVEARLEQRLPALAQKAEELPTMRQQLVQAAVQHVVRQRLRGAQQIRQRTVSVPVPVQPPLAARIDQLVRRQRLQHVQPARPLAARRQPRPPEAIQFQPIPQLQRQPARAPLPRTPNRQLADLHPNRLAGQLRSLPILREQGHRLRARIFAHHLHRPAPRRTLAVVDLAQVQNLTLDHPTVAPAAALHHAPVAVLLAVLEASSAAHVHGRTACPFRRPCQQPRSALQRETTIRLPKNNELGHSVTAKPPEKTSNRSELRKSG